ncbi:dehydrogenase [Paraburkholderia acidicola]|uniref:Dehydrogenase n=1 Tax=Paraburkholderia acidicola TaxID=1912599 RepID=A0A2A4F0Z8_9BURK|nr:SDR family oxidoreductase [Paraburkholderia acidicola]PCE26350.1 dehydrogenase [Paraburkholderia acidicola]
MSKKVALVTGAAHRTGKEIAQYLCQNGYETVIHFNTSHEDAESTVKEIVAAGGHAFALRADLAEEASIEKLIDDVYEHAGQLDLLVNNASVFWQEHFPDFATQDLDLAWKVNCRAPILLTRAFYRKAKEAGTTGVVVNVVDQKVKDNFNRDHFSYTVAKTALGNLTQMLAISAEPVLRVNAVFPGLMLRSDNQTDADFEYASRTANLLGRAANPRDLASAILLLTAPSFVGTDFVVDAGQNLIPVTQDVIYSHRSPGKVEE